MSDAAAEVDGSAYLAVHAEMVAIVTFVQCPSTLAGSSTARHTSITTARGSNIALANFPRIDPIFLTDSDANADLDADAELRVENGGGWMETRGGRPVQNLI